MLKTLFTLIRASSTAKEEALIESNALLLLQQHIKDAEQAITQSKQSLASLLTEKKHLKVAAERLAQQDQTHRQEAKEALDKGREDLATLAAEMIAQGASKTEVTEDRLEKLEREILKLRHRIESQTQRLADLKIGYQKAKAAQAQINSAKQTGSASGCSSSIKQGQLMLERLEAQAEASDCWQEEEDLNQDLDQSSYQSALDEAGIGTGHKARARAILDEIRTSG